MRVAPASRDRQRRGSRGQAGRAQPRAATRSSTRPPSGPSSRARVALSAAVIALSVGVAYANSLAGPFVFDDQLTIVENGTIRSLRTLGRVVRPPLESPVAGRPLVNLTFAVNYAIGSLSVAGYHLVNIGLHALCALLVFGIVRRTLEGASLKETAPGGSAPWMALAVALIWALHPLNTEAVSYVTQRTEVLMAFCYLLTLYCSIRAWQMSRAWPWQALAVASCAAGMACKESMVTAPVMAVAYDAVFVAGGVWAAVRGRRWFYAALAASWAVLAIVGSGARPHSAGFAAGVSAWTYLLNQAVFIPRYLGLAFWPRSLVLLYGSPQALSVSDVLPQLVLLAALIGLTGVMLVRAPKIGFLGLWLWVTLAPTSSIVPIATEVAAERRMYLPLLAVVTLAVLTAVRMLRGRTVLSAVILGSCVLLLAAGTQSRNRDYAQALLLAQTSVERYPSAVGRNGLGVELIKVGRSEEGIAVLRQATAGTPRAHFALGMELFNQGRWREAQEELEAFVRAEPDLIEAVTAREALGRAFASLGDWPPAIEQFRMVLRMNPSRAQREEADGLLAEALFRAERYDEATGAYTRVLLTQPANVLALNHLGVAFAAVNKLPDAIAAFQRAVDVDPENGESQRNLTTALADGGELTRAIPHAEKAVQLRPSDPAAHLLLGKLLTDAGREREARVHLERAARLDAAAAHP